MVLTYKECIDKYGSDYLLKKNISEGKIFQKEKGIYSEKQSCSEIEIITAKYPQAVFTGESAFYYHSLTDVIPDYYYIATKRNDTRFNDRRVRQRFMLNELYDMGVQMFNYNNIYIKIYSIERMLIELMRFRNKLPFDYYKEIINNYRNRVNEMDFGKVEDYSEKFRNGDHLMDMIQMEVL